MIKKFVIGVSAWTATASGLLISKSSSSNDLVFGNYSDYISPKVAQELRKDFNLRIDLFDYDHLVKERFDKGIYDMAIVSTSVLSELKSTGAAMKLDWSQLLEKAGTNGVQGGSTNVKATVEDARILFTDIVKEMSHDLLEYGIPYFVQKLGFYYRGDEIHGLKRAVTFKELVNVISKEERFKSKNGKPTLGLIDDPRTVLSLGRKVSGNPDVNPKDNEYKKSSEILKDYKALINAGLSSDNLGEDFLYMTPDSGPLVDALSNGDIQGAFMYNGDGFFAAYGGNAEKEPEAGQFHTVELAENIFFLDFLAFSNNMPQEKKDKAHKLAKKLLFITKAHEDCPFKAKEEETVKKAEATKDCKSDEEDDDEGEEGEAECAEDESEEESNYEEMAVRNFDDVMYTPVLKSVYEQLDKEYLGIESETVGSVSSSNECKSKLKSKIIKVQKSENVSLEKEYERQLTPQQKSDMLVAYSHFKLLIK